jgi:hypothetical protein
MTTKKDTRLTEQTDLNRESVAPRGEEWKWFFAVLIVFTLIHLLSLRSMGLIH